LCDSHGTTGRFPCPIVKNTSGMYRLRLAGGLWALCAVLATPSARGDGMVFPEVFSPKVEIPNQQALIHWADGMERLVIETSFLGEGTNFAWVVPLPAVPELSRFRRPSSATCSSSSSPAWCTRFILTTPRCCSSAAWHSSDGGR
jgi:hypothetical protein